MLVIFDITWIQPRVTDLLGLACRSDCSNDPLANRNGDGVIDVLRDGVLGPVCGPLHQCLAAIIDEVDDAIDEAQSSNGGFRNVPEYLLEGIQSNLGKCEFVQYLEVPFASVRAVRA